jgi:lysophospholipase L1-like esterase
VTVPLSRLATLQRPAEAASFRYTSPKFLKTFRARLAARAISPVDIVFVGDSKTEGTGATVPANRWQSQFLGLLRAKWQPAGVAGGFGYIPAIYVSSTLSAYSPTLGGAAATKVTPTSNLTYGLGKRSVLLQASGDSITWDLGPASVFGAVTGVDVMYVQGSGQGTFNVTVDGGSPTLVTATDVTNVYGELYQAIRGLDRTVAHTVTCTWVSGAVNISGVMAYDGDETVGIRGWDGGHHGVSATQIAATNNSPWGEIGQVAPALVTYYLGRNDWSSGVAVSTICAQIVAHVAAIRAACTIPPSIILIADYADTAVNSAVEPFTVLRSAIRGVAAADGNLAVLDLYDRIGQITSTATDPLGILATDHIHPSDTVGHPMIADAVLDLLTAAA